MEDILIEELAEAWIALEGAEEGSKEHDELFWAFDRVCDLTHGSPEQAWQFILVVLARASDNRIMEVLAAGPLEDLIVYHGDAVIARVEEEAKRNRIFARLLGGVWKNRMSDSVWARVQAVWDRRGWDGVPES